MSKVSRLKTASKVTRSCVLSLLVSGLAYPAQAGKAPSGFPFDQLPDAQAGECFARVMIPAQYETVTQDIVAQEAGSRIEVSEPQFANRQQQILIREAATRYIVRQPVYKTVRETVMVRPGYDRLVAVQPRYRTVNEQIIVAPARTAWKPGRSLADKARVKVTQTHNGEIYCLVDIPPETRTVSKKVQVSPGGVKRLSVPPLYRTITRQVLVDPGGVSEVPIPAQYANLSVQELTREAQSYEQAIPAQYKKIAKRHMIAPERYEWIRVLCKTNATPEAISAIQTRLHSQGYYNGPIDGRLELGTENAIRHYQNAVGIPHGGYLSLATIEALESGRTAPLPRPSLSAASATAHAYASTSGSISNVAPAMPGYTPGPADIHNTPPSLAGHNSTGSYLSWPGKS